MSTIKRSTIASDTMAQDDKTNSKGSNQDILEELDDILGYIDDNQTSIDFFSNSSSQDKIESSERQNNDIEDSVPTLTTIAEEGDNSAKNNGQRTGASQPGLFSERLEMIKQKAFESEQRKSETQTTVPSYSDALTDNEAANEDNVPTLSNEAEMNTSDLDQIIEILVKEQMPLIEVKLRARLKQYLKDKEIP